MKYIPKIEEINPIDYYNLNCVADAEEILVKQPNVKKVGIGQYTEYLNAGDLDIIKIEFDDYFFKVLKPNNILEDGKYTPFMLMHQLKFKGDFWRALEYVKENFYDLKTKFIRVGIDYFKEIRTIDRYGIIRHELKGWNRGTIVDDYGTSYLKYVDKFDDFTIEPNNINYKRVVYGKYNLYSEPTFKRINEQVNKDDIRWSLIMMEQVFGEQLDLGLQYMKILWEQPKQILPILSLVSTKRHTGKSTFVNWLSIIFGENSVILNPEDLSNQFNGSYANKNILIIEESKFENVQAIEKIKNLSTQEKILVNTKFIRHHSLPFFGKVIITSNDEDKFIAIDDDEIRYWVRKLEPIPKHFYNKDIKGALVKEIPYFLKYLEEDVQLKKDIGQTRMMFSTSDIETDTLKKIKLESRSNLHKDLDALFDEHFINNREVEYIYFVASDVKTKFFSNNSRMNINYIDRVLKKEMKLTKTKPMRYIPFEHDGDQRLKKTGRAYELRNPYYKLDLGEDENEDEVPF